MLSMDEKQLQIGDVAELFAITTKALRHYERIGLLSPERSENGYRVYSAENVLKIQRIRNLQALGLSLKRIKTILTENSTEAVWDGLLENLLSETEQQIAELLARRDKLESLLDEDDDATSITMARAATNNRVNEYLAANLPEPARIEWQRDLDVYASLGLFNQQSRWRHPQQIGYAGPILAGCDTNQLPIMVQEGVF